MKTSVHIAKGNYSISHNLRTFNREKWNTDGHIDYTKTDQNIILINQDIDEFLKEKFDGALDEFNANQKNKERKKDKNQFYSEAKKEIREVIIQLGNENERLSDTSDYEKFFREVLEDWKKNNFSFEVIHASIHFDETTPHMHLDFLPIAESNRGMKTKISINGAFEKIGFSKKDYNSRSNTPFIAWDKIYRERIDKIASQYAEITPADRTGIKKHIQPLQYKINEQKKEIQKNIDILKNFSPQKSFLKSKEQCQAEQIIQNSDLIIKQANEELKKAEKEKKHIEETRIVVLNKLTQYQSQLQAECNKLREKEKRLNDDVNSAYRKINNSNQPSMIERMKDFENQRERMLKEKLINQTIENYENKQKGFEK